MKQKTLRDVMLQAIAAIGVIIINITFIACIASDRMVWPSKLQLAVILGFSLGMYSMSLYSYHTSWGKYIHGPLLFAGILFIPVSIASVIGTWSADSPNLLTTLTWFNNRDYALLIAITIQLILSTSAWWYCKSMASLAGFTLSVYKLYFWVVKAIAPTIISLMSLKSDINFFLTSEIILYISLIIFSYVIHKRFDTLTYFMRWIGITAIGMKTTTLFGLFQHNAWWRIFVWLCLDIAVIAYGMNKDDAFVIGGVLAFFGCAVMGLQKYTESVGHTGGLWAQIAIIITAFAFLFIMLGKRLIHRYST